MSTTTTEEQLAQIRSRIYRLQGRAHDGAPVERHLDALRRQAASVYAVTDEAPDEVAQRLAQLETRLEVAEHSLSVDVSDDWPAFAAAVDAELRCWDTYLERLQTNVAARAWKTRERAEAAIAELRSRRIAVGERLSQAGVTAEEQRKRVVAARDELQQRSRRVVGQLQVKGARVMNVEAQLQQGERDVARMWKVSVLRGVVAIAFGAVILIWPSIGLSALIALFGAFALVSGSATLVGAFSVPSEGGDRAWLVIDGLIGIAIGVAVFVWPGLSALGLLYFIAIWAIALGLSEIALAFVLPLTGGRSLLAVIGGLLSIAFGVIMFAHPGAGAIALAGARRGARDCERRHADRVRDRAASRRRRARAALPAARDGEARHPRLEERRGTC